MFCVLGATHRGACPSAQGHLQFGPVLSSELQGPVSWAPASAMAIAWSCYFHTRGRLPRYVHPRFSGRFVAAAAGIAGKERLVVNVRIVRAHASAQAL